MCFLQKQLPSITCCEPDPRMGDRHGSNLRIPCPRVLLLDKPDINLGLLTHNINLVFRKSDSTAGSIFILPKHTNNHLTPPLPKTSSTHIHATFLTNFPLRSFSGNKCLSLFQMTSTKKGNSLFCCRFRLTC